MGRGRVAGSDWTMTEIDEVATLWAEGLSAGQISERVPRTRNALLGMMSRNREKFAVRTLPGKRPGGMTKGRVRTKPWLDEHQRIAERLWRAGISKEEIGRAIGKSGSAVSDYTRRRPQQFPVRIKTAAKPTVVLFAAQGPKPAELAAAAPEAPNCKPVTLLKRGATQCCFPMWEHYGAKPTTESPYCGGDVQAGTPYCAFHRRLMRRAPTETEKRDGRRAA